MKKKAIFCLVLVLGFCFSGPVSAISEGQKTAIMNQCETIRDNLKNVQRLDSRTRVFLGSHYETILTKYITALNVRLLENNMSDAELITNQSDFAKAKSTFAIDFVVYQQGLEELIGTDCKKEPEKFYERLVRVREKREIMVIDVKKMKSLATKNVNLVKKMKENL